MFLRAPPLAPVCPGGEGLGGGGEPGGGGRDGGGGGGKRDRSLRGRYQRRKMVVPTTRKEKARKTKLPCKGGSREKKVSFVRAAEATSEDSDSTTFFTENDKQKLFYTDASINVSFLAQEGALYQGLFSWLPTWFLLQP